MDLYEYQARELLEEQHIPTPRAVFAQNSHEVAEAADAIGYPCVIKAQVKIGHRGQAGGVKIAHNRDEAILLSESILPMTIHGHKVNGVLVAEAKNILHEYYVSISVDRTSRDFDVLATANGGTEVEEIAKEHPESVKRLHINALGDFDMEAAKRMAGQIGFYHADLDQAANILLRMWQCFKDNDATLVEINPLAKIGDPDDEASKSLCALDAKISLDGNAAFRHDGWTRFDDPMQADPFEAAAAEHGLHYVHLDGQVGVIGNGAGLVMSSLDAVWDAGKEQGTNVTPANFLDIGGGASAAVMSDSLSIVLSDPQVESVFINVYGGITSCEQVAKGVLQAFEELHTSKPLVVRFDGEQPQPTCGRHHGAGRSRGRSSGGERQGIEGGQAMTAFIQEGAPVIVQGMTGHQGMTHTARMLRAGTNIVGGVNPRKAGNQVTFEAAREGRDISVPVYATCAEAKEATGAQASVVFVPPRFAKGAVVESVEAGIGLIVVITEGIPVADSAYFVELALQRGVRIIGPNCPGLLTLPSQENEHGVNLGIIPDGIVGRGPIGLVSKSGTLTYQLMGELSDIGFTACLGIGGDPIVGTTLLEALQEFEQDADTKAVVMIGEIGGSAEQDAAAWAAEHMTKPVVAYIAGFTAPEGKQMGHAGAIVSGGKGTAQDKKIALEAAGIPVGRTPGQTADLMRKVLAERSLV